MLGEPPLNRSDDTRAPGSGGAPAGHHLLGGRWPQRTQLPDEERCLREALTLRTWGIAHRPSGPLSAKRVQGSTAPASEVCQEEVMTGEGPGPMIWGSGQFLPQTHLLRPIVQMRKLRTQRSGACPWPQDWQRGAGINSGRLASATTSESCTLQAV